ncbi:MAG: Cytochrome-c peroxidase, partial [Armatimonadetes bacterium]|nr:Cytochrome-c peroxidase [Armatimonadota bacterium]
MKINVRRLIPGTLAGSMLLVVGVALLPTVADAQRDQAPKAPLGLPPIPWPADNPYSKEKAELGKLLYYDTRMSTDQTVSCASCHAPEKAFGDGQPVSTGIKKQKGGRSAPTVINRAYSTL